MQAERIQGKCGKWKGRNRGRVATGKLRQVRLSDSRSKNTEDQ